MNYVPNINGKNWAKVFGVNISYNKGTNLVLLSPDVAKAFPTEEAVNQALRSLIEIAQRSVTDNQSQPI